jgi:hypothetical protein
MKMRILIFVSFDKRVEQIKTHEVIICFARKLIEFPNLRALADLRSRGGTSQEMWWLQKEHIVAWLLDVSEQIVIDTTSPRTRDAQGWKSPVRTTRTCLATNPWWC